MKKWIVRIAIGLVVLLVATVCIVFFSLNSVVKKGVELVGTEVTKTEVKLGTARIFVFTGSGELSDFSIGNPEGFSTNHPAIKVGSVKLSIKPSSLFLDVIEVDEINVQAPEITLEGKLGGSNLGKIMDNLKSVGGASNSAPAAKSEKAKKEKNIFIKDLVVNGGKIRVTLTVIGGKGATVLLPPIHLQNIGTQDKGVTVIEASRQILQQILSEAIKASAQGANELGKGLKDAGSGVVDQAGKAVESIKGIFKK